MAKFSVKNLTPAQKSLRKKILEISFKRNFSHLGSSLSSIDLIYAVYLQKKSSEEFVLSSGHAALAWYVVLNHFKKLAAKHIDSLEVHPKRNPKLGISVSTGSLGHGLPIALGMALADRTKKVYCLISDGECYEGSIWETFALIHKLEVKNLITIINANGWSAYDPLPLKFLKPKLKAFFSKIKVIDGHNLKEISEALQDSQIIVAKTSVEQFPFLKGLDAHYYKLDETFNKHLEGLK